MDLTCKYCGIEMDVSFLDYKSNSCCDKRINERAESPIEDSRNEVISILNKYQDRNMPLHDEGCIDPMDFYKVADDIMCLMQKKESSKELLSTTIEQAAAEFADKLQSCTTHSTIRYAFISGAKFILNRKI